MNAMHSIFDRIPDPRQPGKIKHNLAEILIVCVLGVLANASSSYEIHIFAQLREAWLRKVLTLENGIPGRLTIERVLRTLNPKHFEAAFEELMRLIARRTKGRVIAIDGKTYHQEVRADGTKDSLYLVSAWCSTNGLTLGAVETDHKSNEITAIPELLELLDVQNGIVTIDAIGCQKAIVAQIRKQKADYVIGLKKNHPQLYQDCQDYAQSAIGDKLMQDRYQKYRPQAEKGHGRIEHRTYYLFPDLSWLEQKKDWVGLQAILRVDSRRQQTGRPETNETRYYLTSLTDVKKAAFASRKHWGIENNLHWGLDVVFGEDDWHTRQQTTAANLSRIRRLTINLLKADPSFPDKMTMPGRRYACSLDPQVLDRVIFLNPFFAS